jgi:hypothetical protein
MKDKLVNVLSGHFSIYGINNLFVLFGDGASPGKK